MDSGINRSRATPWFVFCTAVAGIYFARDFLAPIALAGFIAFVTAPLVRGLTRRRVPRALATSLILGGVAVAHTALGWLLVGQLRSFADKLPEYRSNLQAKVEDFHLRYGGSLERASSAVRSLGGDVAQAHGQAAAVPAPAASSIEFGSSLVPNFIGSLALFGSLAAFVFLLSWVMLLRWEDLRDRLLELAGRTDLYITTSAGVEASAKVTAYVRKQLLVNILYGTVLGLVLAWIGVPNPLVWGILAAALRFIPYLGPAISTLAPIAVSLASSDGWSQAWLTASALVSLEIITCYIVEPLVYGACTGVSPLALLVSAAFWTWLWGPVGLVLSTPLTVCLLVVGKHFPRLRIFEVLMGDQPAMPERSRLYHRMLVGDQDQAWDILRNRTSLDGELAAADGLLLPALALAGQAVRDGTIDVEQRDRIATLTHALVGELEDSRRAEKPIPSPDAQRILCVSARDAFDAVGTRLLAAELERRGCQVSSTSDGEFTAETCERIHADPSIVVCVSSVAPTHFLQVRAMCKRLLQSGTKTQIVLGLWGEDLEHAELEQRLPPSPRIQVVTSLTEAVGRALALANGPVASEPVQATAAQPIIVASNTSKRLRAKPGASNAATHPGRN